MLKAKSTQIIILAILVVVIIVATFRFVYEHSKQTNIQNVLMLLELQDKISEGELVYYESISSNNGIETVVEIQQYSKENVLFVTTANDVVTYEYLESNISYVSQDDWKTQSKTAFEGMGMTYNEFVQQRIDSTLPGAFNYDTIINSFVENVDSAKYNYINKTYIYMDIYQVEEQFVTVELKILKDGISVSYFANDFKVTYVVQYKEVIEQSSVEFNKI